MIRLASLSSVAASLTLAAAAACGGSGDQPTGVSSSAVASVVVAPDSTLLVPGRVAQLSLAVRDAKGAALTGRTIVWSSTDNSKVTVTPAGQVTALAVGRAVVTATSEGKSGSTVVVVSQTLDRDFTITGAQFTQGVQDASGSIPMVLSGSAAAVNVLVQASPPSNTPMQLVLRLMDANGAVVYTDTAVTRFALGASPSYVSPSAQFLVPSSRITSGLRWQIVRDPRGIAADDITANDVYPAAGPQTLATVSVPPLTIRFVPIVLAAHGNTAPTVTDASLPEYLRTLKSIHPLGLVNAHVGAPFTTSQSFGTPPNGGEASFWTSLLAELDLARIADPTESTANWYGVVSPPAGFTFTSFGGFSYIPTQGSATGAHTRTSVGVRTGWFSRPTQARDLVAHELAHTFGRSHAPCGGAGAPLDPNYPVPGGVLDVEGHDVYSWENGLASSAVVVPTSTGDVMGYCFPVWASLYTYKAVLQFRQPQVIAARATAVSSERTRVIVVRGSIEHEKTINLQPAFTLTARPTVSDPADTYHLDGLSADGRVLFSSSFTPAVLDHTAGVKHFTVAVPVSAALEDELAEVRVRGALGEASLRRTAPAAVFSAAPPTVAQRVGSTATTVGCGDASARGIVLLDERTGAVLGTASSGSMPAVLASGAHVSVLCSDGVRTRRGSVVAP